MTRFRSRTLSPSGAAARVPAALALCAAFFCAAPACSDASKHPSLISAGGETEPEGGRSGAAAGGADGDSGAPNADAGEAGDSPGSGGLAGAAPGHPEPGPSVCSLTASWASPTSVEAVSSAAGETLLSVTPDELDLAFLRAGVLYVAHRARVSDPFEIGAPVAIPVGFSTAQGASLSADGKRLILVGDPEQYKLGEMSRTTRDAAFSGNVDESAFADVNQSSTYTGRIYAYPLVSPGDDQLYFNSAYPDAGSTVVVSTRDAGGVWSTPSQLTGVVLDGALGKRRLPTGVSSDERTLFYFNEESAHEEARFRDTSQQNSPLYDMITLGTRRGAIPNFACDRLYSESNSDVVVEKD